MIILDTNVVSELMRTIPSPQVEDWLNRQDRAALAITTISIAEILRGIWRLPAGRRREALMTGFDHFMRATLSERTVSFDRSAAYAFGPLAARKVMAGVNADTVDLMIAAIALSRDAAIATRNTRDFEDCSIAVINPWEVT